MIYPKKKKLTNILMILIIALINLEVMSKIMLMFIEENFLINLKVKCIIFIQILENYKNLLMNKQTSLN